MAQISWFCCKKQDTLTQNIHSCESIETSVGRRRVLYCSKWVKFFKALEAALRDPVQHWTPGITLWLLKVLGDLAEDVSSYLKTLKGRTQVFGNVNLLSLVNNVIVAVSILGLYTNQRFPPPPFWDAQATAAFGFFFYNKYFLTTSTRHPEQNPSCRKPLQTAVILNHC